MGIERTQRHLTPTGFILILVLCVVILALLGRWFLPPALVIPPVLITEFCAHNGTGIRDKDGDHSDWIELFNSGAYPVQLDGWSLTDDFRRLSQWRFPKVELGPGKYLVVFASGKDRHESGGELHTNFKLSDAGEYLALVLPDGVTVVDDFFPKYPHQTKDVSYGLTDEGIRSGEGPLAARYFAVPTPGGPNREELFGLAKPVHFSRPSGFYEGAMHASLSTTTRGGSIYYSLDGSMPTPANATLYRGPISVRTTTVIRAVAVAPGMATGEPDSRTYIFPQDVARQTGGNLPLIWGKQDDWTAPAHYGMSPEIANDPAYHARLQAGLMSLPTLSILTDPGNLFDPESGIYTHPMTNGAAWERPASVEMFGTNEWERFRIHCGLRIQGGWNRQPLESPKHSLRLLFKKDYGPSKLDFPLFGTNGAVEFETVILRGGNNNSWLHWSGEERSRADYVRDEWMRRTFQAMGHPTARGRFVQVYINGLYWGLYNLCERPGAPFMAASTPKVNPGSGVQTNLSKRDFDSMNAGKMLSGDKTAWNELMALVNGGLDGAEQYRAVQERLDLAEVTDYLILNFYGGNGDWDRASNWYAARARKPGGKYQFLQWDGERTLEGVDVNTIDFDDDESPPRVFHKLAENREYRMFFADRVQRLLFGSGPLAPESAAGRYRDLARGIVDAVVPESARWGNYRRDLHQYKVGPYQFYKPDSHWLPEVNRLTKTYFAQRPEALLKQFRERGLYPEIPAPAGALEKGLITFNVGVGAIYYTTDGSDPRLAGGVRSPGAVAYVQPVPLAAAGHLKARALRLKETGNEWSALVEF
jgi:hypothetical protein